MPEIGTVRVPHVVRAGLAPVKGTRHRTEAAVTLDAHGPVGDRAFCLVDVARREVLRTVRNRSLVAVTATWDGEVLAVALPTGETAAGVPTPSGERVRGDYWGRQVDLALTDGPHSPLLSSYLGRDVRLAAAPRGGVVYGAPVSILSTASLRDVAARASRDDLLDTCARFRMTLVVEAGDEPYLEDGWIGRDVEVGDAVVRITAAVARCAVIDLDPATGEKDGSLLRALAAYRPTTGGEPWLGVQGHVVSPGVVRTTSD